LLLEGPVNVRVCQVIAASLSDLEQAESRTTPPVARRRPSDVRRIAYLCPIGIRARAIVPMACWLYRSARRFAASFAVSLFESLDAAGGVHDLLLTGIERMAVGTNFNVDFRNRGAGLKSVTAGAGNRTLNIFGMDSLFHSISPQSNCRTQPAAL